MADWLVLLAIIGLTLSRMVRLDVDVAKTVKYIKEGLQDRVARKRQQNCRHSWQIEYDHPYSWCVRCQKFVPTESLVYMKITGQLR